MARNKLARRCKHCHAIFDPGDYWHVYHRKSADVRQNMRNNPRWCPACNLLKEYRKPMPQYPWKWNVNISAYHGRWS